VSVTGPSRKPLLLYGCNGYTARLLVPRLRALGIDLVVAGRNEAAVHAVAAESGSVPSVFALEDPARVDECVENAAVVLNAAGPFSRTAPPLIDACLRKRVDYLDLSGELEPITYAAECGAFARSLGVMLLPAIGFDVVPSDCLAVHLAERFPGAEHLTLSISASNLLSRGSARTFAENAGTWVQVRRGGTLEPMRLRTQTRWMDFGEGERPTIAVSWGDLVTAFHSTGIPNIEVYFEATAFRWFAVTANQFWGWALRGDATKAWLEAMARSVPNGPDEAERAAERSVIVAEVACGSRRRRARLVTPEAYSFTAEVATRVALDVLRGKRRPGFHTPAQLLGADFVLQVPGVTRESLS
jgi:short subunit dehydrogenase-like uncharacterized protein